MTKKIWAMTKIMENIKPIRVDQVPPVRKKWSKTKNWQKIKEKFWKKFEIIAALFSITGQPSFTKLFFHGGRLKNFVLIGWLKMGCFRFWTVPFLAVRLFFHNRVYRVSLPHICRKTAGHFLTISCKLILKDFWSIKT